MTEEDRLREVLPDVWTWPWFSERHGYDFNGYLVRHDSGNLAIDPVEMSEAVLERIASLGVARILVTNRNHTRASRRLHERTGAPVAVHPADAAHARAQGTPVHDDLLPGRPVGPFAVIDAHGKSPGEVALHWPERRILVIGDACVGAPPGACRLLPESVIDDASALRSSLTRIARELDFEALLLADGEPILSGGRAALGALVRTFDGARGRS
jgi:glyoxylase-like metal-dependent hydrolase (beta-lactamase superfamily II)